MAFAKTATAAIVHPSTTVQQWGVEVRSKVASKTAKVSSNLIDQASSMLGQPFDPSKYLLTHATIVCSVDTVNVPNTKLGSVRLPSGFNVNRKYSDYRIKPSCDKFINNNNDAWSRGVIAKSFDTFRGGHNFVEHVQIVEQSKGRIIDAVSRDVGDSVYVDILIATDRKHSGLIRQIESGKMATLSMGCFLPGTQVVMADGRRVAIEEVQPGDMVLSHTGHAREVLNKQLKYNTWGIRRIRAAGVPSTINATDDHPFYVFRPARTCACGCGEQLPEYKGGGNHTARRLTRRFKRGHDKRVFNPNNTYDLDEYRQHKARLNEIQTMKGQWLRADELREGDMVCFPRAQIKGGQPTTEGKARLLGYFLAEGSFLKRNGERVEVEFTFSLEEKGSYVAEVCDLLRQEFPEAGEPRTYGREDRNTCSVRITSREVAEWFYAHGGEYSHGKKLSQEVLGWSEDHHRHLIGAWVNGDGTCHSVHGSTSVTTVSYDLMSQMHMLMARCGMWARAECRVGAHSVEINQVVNGGTISLERETGRRPSYTLVLGKMQSQSLQGFTDKVENSAHTSQVPTVTEGHVLFPITSIESDIYTGWVHNMEVDEDNSYVVEGVASHNCSVDFTICTKCGHVAVDETELCPHIKYEKGNYFFDDQGKRHRVAELCGHSTIDPTGGVTFIEASWVETPAFQGAVLRNILDPISSNSPMARRVQAVLSELPPSWDDSKRAKAAYAVMGLFDDEEEEEGGEEDAEEPTPQDRIKEVVDDTYDEVTKRVKRRVKKDLEEKGEGGQEATSPNDNLVKTGAVRPTPTALYGYVLNHMSRIASNDADLMDKVALVNRAFGVEIPVTMYRVALHVGSLDPSHEDQEVYWRHQLRTASRKFNLTKLGRRELATLRGLCSLMHRRSAQDVG